MYWLIHNHMNAILMLQRDEPVIAFTKWRKLWNIWLWRLVLHFSTKLVQSVKVWLLTVLCQGSWVSVDFFVLPLPKLKKIADEEDWGEELVIIVIRILHHPPFSLAPPPFLPLPYILCDRAVRCTAGQLSCWGVNNNVVIGELLTLGDLWKGNV